MNRTLSSIFYNPNHPAAFSSARRLHQYAKVLIPSLTVAKVEQWLKKQLTFTLHKQARQKFKRNPVIVSRVDEQWQCDLVDMSRKNLPNFNQRRKYILVCIDLLSRYLWTRSLINKSAESVATNFEDFISSGNRIPEKVQTDRGTEFVNEIFRQVCRKYNINCFTTRNSVVKAAVVERANRTLKSKLYKYFTAQNTLNWVNVLDNMTKAYNSRWHRTIKARPRDVNPSNQQHVVRRIYGTNDWFKIYQEHGRQKQLTGFVRSARGVNRLDKGYLPRWTDELYEISGVYKKAGKLMYNLKDSEGNILRRRFYRDELQPVSSKTESRYRILSRKFEKGKQLVRIRWLGYPATKDEWIPKEELTKLRKRTRTA